MSVNTQTVQVDLNTGKIQAVVYAHQNDSNRSIVFEVFNNGAVFSLTGSTVKFGLKSPTVKGQYTVIAGSGMASGSVSGNKVTFEIPEEYTKIAGVGLLTMIITNSSKTIRPVNIKFVIHESADGDSVVAGSSDFPTKMEDIVDEWMTDNVSLYVDETLSVPDMAAEAEATGQALAMKKLMTDDDDILYLQDSFTASDQQIVQLAEVVGAWLTAHPEATTTVQNGSITAAKINSSFLSTIVNPTTPYLSLNEGTAIATNADLNNSDYVAPAVYTCKNNDTAETLDNCPTTHAFTMSVRSLTGEYNTNGTGNFLLRELYPLDFTNNVIWRQVVSSDANGNYSFEKWVPYSSDNRFSSHTITFNGKNFYFYRVGRIVICNSGGDIQSLQVGYNDVGTLPNEYHPATQVISPVGNAKNMVYFFTVSTDGLARVYSDTEKSSAYNCGINAIWIAKYD